MKADEHVLGKIELSNASAGAGALPSEADLKLTQMQGYPLTGIPMAPQMLSIAQTCTPWNGGHLYQAVVKKTTVKRTTEGSPAVTVNTYTLFCARCGDSKPLK